MNKQEMTKLRLTAREQRLQARAHWHMDRAKGNLDYLRTNGVRIIGNDVAQNLATTSPLISKAVSYITGNKRRSNNNQEVKKRIIGMVTGPRASYSTREMPKATDLLTLDGIKAAILPTLYTLGGMKLLSYSLKGTRKLVNGGIKRLFGWGRNKK